MMTQCVYVTSKYSRIAGYAPLHMCTHDSSEDDFADTKLLCIYNYKVRTL